MPHSNGRLMAEWLHKFLVLLQEDSLLPKRIKLMIGTGSLTGLCHYTNWLIPF
jgi:hypothetical protein